MTGKGVARAASERSLAAIAAAGRPEVWISVFSPADVLAAADAVDATGDLPLAGLTFAVKDNIDVEGLPTTAGCPAFAYRPESDAPAVQALSDAGAVCIGKTNLDQFATGLVGTRSPYGAVRNAVDPSRISGGSSSGSAVAVALGLVDVALGTDTAGSGRVPAALNGIVGIKATRGLVSVAGVVPACRSFDCVTVFAADVDLGERVMATLIAASDDSPGRRPFPGDTRLAARFPPTVACPDTDVLDLLDPGRRSRFQAAVEHLSQLGCRVVEIDLEPFLDAGRLLYQGAFVAERHAAVGEWIDAHPDEVDPTVGAIIRGAKRWSASQLVSDMERLAVFQVAAASAWQQSGADSLLLPTVAVHPTLAEVAADPVGINTQLGHFTTFLNLLDMCAVAVPFGTVDRLPFGVSCIGPAFSDLVQADIARLIEGSGAAAPGDWRSARDGRPSTPSLVLAVVGAHLSGQPLNHQLTDLGARLMGQASTAGTYRLYALDTVPAKPGLVRVGVGGDPIALEVWELSRAGFAEFVANVPPPMVIGKVELSDGSLVPGFLCEARAIESAIDITGHGGWRAYLAACSK
jgi:allophanate hydrolase